MEKFFQGKTILVIGGTGRVGRHVVSKLIKMPYVNVRCLVRHTKRATQIIPEAGTNPNLVLVEGDLSRLETVVSATSDVDFVIASTGATHWISPLSPLVWLGLKKYPRAHPKVVDYEGMKNLVLAVKQSPSVQHIVFISTIFVTRPWTLPSIFLNGLLSMAVGWKLEAERVLMESGLNYTIIRPGGLVDQAIPNTVPHLFQGDTCSGRIDRVAVADLLIESLYRQQAVKTTFECISVPSEGEGEGINWDRLKPDRKKLPEVRHSTPFWVLLGIIIGCLSIGYRSYIW